MSQQQIEDAIRRTTMYKRLSESDRQHLARVSRLKSYAKGDRIFGEGDPSEFFSVVVSGRVKIVKMTPAGKDVILEIFATGDPFGAVAAYEGRAFPASGLGVGLWAAAEAAKTRAAATPRAARERGLGFIEEIEPRDGRPAFPPATGKRPRR